MPELLALQGKDKTIDIVKEIGVQWRVVGIHLLNDESGATIEAIDEQFRGNVQAINLEILKRWLRGEGLRDCTWRVLLGVLRKAHCVELAESADEVLTDEEAEQGKSYFLFFIQSAKRHRRDRPDTLHHTRLVNRQKHLYTTLT